MKNEMKNVGTIDRIIRAIIGGGLLWFGLRYEGSFIFSVLAIIVGIALLVTTVTGFCFILRMLGLNTCNGKVDR